MQDVDYILPDDYTEESQDTENTEVEAEQETTETAETAENAPVEEAQAEEVATEQEEQPFLIAKYNKAEIPLDADTAKNLAQLGMFYQDKIQPEFERLKAVGEQYGKMEQLAGLYGMTTEQLHETLYNQYIESAAQAEGITPEQKRKEQELAQKEAQINAQMTAKQQEQASQEMYSKFLSAYPDVKAEQIKPETWAKVDQGIDLVTAYTMQLNAELQQQMKQAQQVTKNKQSSPAVATTTNGGAEPAKDDDFLQGLFGGI